MGQVVIEESWRQLLTEEFEKPYFKELSEFVREEYQTQIVYPLGKLIFNAFDKCRVDQVKVVILGQDPYHGKGQAHGLCFSVSDGVGHPPSLRNIFKELNNELGISIPQSGNLERWAIQGVFLLNATLTVRSGSPGSHQNKGWEIFTDRVISLLSEHRYGLVFLLWGAYAQKKASLIDNHKHLVLQAPHPSPFSADRGFFGCNHFIKTNEYLKNKRWPPIDW